MTAPKVSFPIFGDFLSHWGTPQSFKSWTMTWWWRPEIPHDLRNHHWLRHFKTHLVAVISSAQPRFRRISRLQNTKPTMKITKKTVLLVVVVSSDIPHGGLPWWIGTCPKQKKSPNHPSSQIPDLSQESFSHSHAKDTGRRHASRNSKNMATESSDIVYVVWPWHPTLGWLQLEPDREPPGFLTRNRCFPAKDWSYTDFRDYPNTPIDWFKKHLASEDTKHE